jgi:SAM-dependent methyltransferase
MRPFDAFVCFHSARRDAGERLCNVLREAGYAVVIGPADIPVGSRDSYQQCLASAVIIVFVAADGTGPWHEVRHDSWKLILSAHAVPLIPVLAEGADEIFYSDELIQSVIRTRASMILETRMESFETLQTFLAAVRNGPVDNELISLFVKEAFFRSTIDFYERAADRFVKKWDGDRPPATRAAAAAFLSLVKSGGPSRRTRILDVGCGPGGDARDFAGKTEADVTGIDACERFISYARSKSEGLNCNFIVGDMRRLDTLVGRYSPFDGVWASASCLHLPRELLDAQLNQFRSVLRSDGVLGASFQMGISAVQWDGRLFERYEPSELRERFRRQGFGIVCEMSSRTTKSTLDRKQEKEWFTMLAINEKTLI